jgi:uncharacterized protein (DUF1330 family)
MACYFLAEIDVHAPAPYRDYVEQASTIVPRYGGEYVFRSEAIIPVSGGWSPKRMLLIRFPDREALQRCFASPEYLAIKHLRENSTTSRAIIIQDEA